MCGATLGLVLRVAALSVCLVSALALAGARASDGAPHAGGSHYLVRPDPRLCPSPMCGGAWVRRVNHPTTRCGDGKQRRECYVSSLTRVPKPLWSVLSGTVLTRGRLAPAGITAFPGLEVLSVTAAWRPGGKRAPQGTTFRVTDNGVRCITSPCFSLSAAPLESAGLRTVSDLDLRQVGATQADLLRAARALDTARGLLVTGAVHAVPDAGPAGTGRTLRATQFWLPVVQG